MGTYVAATWEPDLTLPGRRNQQGGEYHYYVPDRLSSLNLKLDCELSRYLAQIERKVRALVNADGIDNLESLSRFLLRSEAIASSQIEGIMPAAKHVALAEIGETEGRHGISETAQLVARNMTVVQDASQKLAHANEVTVQHLIELQTALLGSNRAEPGLRNVQNWIGASNYHPIGADYVPPAPHLVPELVADLLDYLNGATHGPIIQAALVHAQFETIHPFTDGNGRVGRALIHTVLTRRGLTPRSVLPVSLVLSTLRDAYVASLSMTRFVGTPSEAGNEDAISQWIRLFASAVEQATIQAEKLRDHICELELEWRAKVDEHRSQQGKIRAMRSDSALAQIMSKLAGTPVLTAKTASDIYGIAPQNAHDALTQLADAGVMTTRSIARGTFAYIATDVLELVTVAERALASTRFDTRVSPSIRPVSARP